MTLNVILNDKINGIGFDVTDQRFSSSGSGLWSLNRTEWTGNGPGPELDNNAKSHTVMVHVYKVI